MPDTQLASERRIRRFYQQERALELRLRGLTYAEGARQMGMRKQPFWRLVQKALAEHASKLVEQADRARAMELLRLDRMDRALQGDDSPRAIDTKLRISERRARLQGLDMPIKIASTDATGEIATPPVVNVHFHAPEAPEPDKPKT